MIPNVMTARVAVMAFLIAARREAVARNPHQPISVPSWEGFDADAKATFTRCMVQALEAAKPENVQKVMDAYKAKGVEF